MLVMAVLFAPAAPAAAQASTPFTDTTAQRAQACTVCHGEQGRASPAGYVPRLAGKPALYLFEQTQAFRDGRRAHRGMAQLLHNVDDTLLRELAEHFAQQRPPYPPPVPARLSAADSARAQALVHRGLPSARLPACASCHGDRLMGDGLRVPALLGLPRDYLLAQLGAWREGRRRGHEPDCMAEVVRRLPAADLAVVAGWLAAQPVPAEAAVHAAGPARPPGAEHPMGLRCADGPPADALPAPRPPPARAALVEQGRRVALLGHCAGCHQQPGGRALSGGPGLSTPFGTVYAGNLTPDPGTGLGAWSADDFWQALHHGRGRDGRRLLPAFPYTSYTHLTRADSDALFAYLQSLPPVVQQRPAHDLRFPYGTQAALVAWQALFFEPGGLRVPPGADALLTRGRYLVEGPGHCLECHAPRNRWGARSDTASGGLMPDGAWWAPPLAAAPGQTTDELVQLLRTGRNRHGSAVGPMAAVVSGSTQHWPEADLRAVAAYLVSLRPPAARPAVPTAAAPGRRALGQRVYEQHCAGCHGAQGQGAGGSGGRPAIAPLAGNPSVTQGPLNNLLSLLRQGAFGAGTVAHPRPFGMPPHTLSVAEQAAVLTHLRQSWGHAGAEVTEVDVLTARP
jgi:cytochrome c553